MGTVFADVRAAWLKEFRATKAQIDAALAQLSDEQFRTRIAEGTNSCAAIVKHLAGNMRSRWTDWLTTDGEKPDRDREREFDADTEARPELMRRYEAGWGLVFGAIEALTEADVGRTVRIRGEPYTAAAAVERQMAHYGYHAGQIQLIARIVHGNPGWTWHTVAPGASEAFNRAMAEKHGTP